jgi:hypothetical protein
MWFDSCLVDPLSSLTLPLLCHFFGLEWPTLRPVRELKCSVKYPENHLFDRLETPEFVLLGWQKPLFSQLQGFTGDANHKATLAQKKRAPVPEQAL